MDLKEEAFLQSLGKCTRKSYRAGLREFEQYSGKSVDEILKLRERDLNSKDTHQKRRFEREIENFRQSLLDKGCSVSDAQEMTRGIIQVFSFYGMPIQKICGDKRARSDKLLAVVDKALKQIFGENAATVLSVSIYKYLEEKYSLERVDIPNEPKLFKEALEECLGESGASLVFGMILNESSELKVKKVLWVYDPLEQRTKVSLS